MSLSNIISWQKDKGKVVKSSDVWLCSCFLLMLCLVSSALQFVHFLGSNIEPNQTQKCVFAKKDKGSWCVCSTKMIQR